MCKLCSLATRISRDRQESFVFDLSQFATAVKTKPAAEPSSRVFGGMFSSGDGNGFQLSENFAEILQVTCYARNVPALATISPEQLEQVRSQLQFFSQQWQSLALEKP